MARVYPPKVDRTAELRALELGDLLVDLQDALEAATVAGLIDWLLTGRVIWEAEKGLYRLAGPIEPPLPRMRWEP